MLFDFATKNNTLFVTNPPSRGGLVCAGMSVRKNPLKSGSLYSGTGGSHCSGICGSVYSGMSGSICSGLFRNSKVFKNSLLIYPIIKPEKKIKKKSKIF